MAEPFSLSPDIIRFVIEMSFDLGSGFAEGLRKLLSLMVVFVTVFSHAGISGAPTFVVVLRLARFSQGACISIITVLIWFLCAESGIQSQINMFLFNASLSVCTHTPTTKLLEKSVFVRICPLMLIF